MDKNEIETVPELRRIALLLYLLGCGFWLVVWYFVGGYALMNRIKLLWFPFLSCFAILISNLLLWIVATTYEEFERESNRIEFVERNAAHMITAITGSLIIAAAISAMKSQVSLPKEFIIFQSIAFICTAVGVLPLYWIPSERTHWLVMLRHFKTVPFTYGISLFLGGLLILLCWL